MAISERINAWIEERRQVWGEALGKFLLNTLSAGATKFIEDMEPDAIANVLDILERIKTDENTPPEVKAMVDRIEAGGHPIPLLIVIPLAILFLLPMVLSLSQPLANLLNYGQEKAFKTYRLDPQSVINAWRRDPEAWPQLVGDMTDQGVTDFRTEFLKLITEARFDPQTITSLWLRDKEKYQGLWQDLRDTAYSEDRIAAFQELAKIIPPLADMVRFADFGSFDPTIIELWRQFYDAPSWISEPMSLLGITNEEGRDWANKYWFSHWRQPGRFELGEIYRRGLLGTPKIGQGEIGGDTTPGPAEELVKNAYLTQGFSAFWQDHLLQLVREVPTRVDVRRWWDMRTIDEVELREIYQRQGYFGKDLENYVLWTKVYVAFPDLIARYSNGWITQEKVRTELTTLGMPAERVEEMLQTKFKKGETAKVDEAKKVSQTAIIKWVKEDLEARWEQGVDLLMDFGYDEEGARFVLDAYIADMGSPQTYEDWKKLTTGYLLATGREEKPMPEEIKVAADKVVELSGEVQALEESITEEKRGHIEGEILPEETTARLKSLEVKRNRALAKLSKAKAHYNRLVAEWKHDLP